MDNSEESKNDHRLRKYEILRGHNSFKNVLQNSGTISTEYLKAFVNKQPTETNITEFSKSPLFTGNVKVGFIIAKKKFKKAVIRNRIRRILKEAYRLNNTKSDLFNLKLNIIFTLSENGYELFRNNTKLKPGFIRNDMNLLTAKIKLKYPSL
ncbi:MAG TPA: ribonuclease P protein component [Ignavibacteria bacterium]|nr:ribonuclease P protein component [Ignavibacteria bacterium]HMR39186.1 ribonuclease P protein component [Ignavibacteria bacterium]